MTTDATKPRKGPRPMPVEGRWHTVHSKVDTPTYAALEYAAVSQKLTISQWLRQLIIEAVKEPEPSLEGKSANPTTPPEEAA